MPRMLKPELEIARQACIYGKDGDGNPVMNVKKLMEISGIGEHTIRKYLPTWQAERESIVTSSSPVALGVHLSKKQLDQNTKDLEFVRNQMNIIKFEIESNEKISARLADWMDRFDGDDVQMAMQIFSSWERSAGSVQALRSQFVTLKKLWDEKSAIDGLRDVALVREREMEKGRVKIKLRQEGAEVEPRNVGPVSGGVFARKTQEVPAIECGDTRDQDLDEE